MGYREESVRSQSPSHVDPKLVRASRFRVFWWWFLVWGTAIGVAAVIGARVMFPQAQLAGPTILKVTCCLGAAMGFGAVAYYIVVFALNRTLRDLFLACAFGAIAAGSAFQTARNSFTGGQLYNDRIVLVTWLFAGLLFTGAAYATSSMRRGSVFRTALQMLVAVAAMAAYPVVVFFYVVNPALYDRLQGFPNELVASRFDSVFAFAAAGLIVAAVVRFVRCPTPKNDRLDRILSNFYVACALGLVCRGLAASSSDIFWFCGQVLPVSAWLVLAAGFAAESAVTHKELLDRLGELEALHDVSWSLVGTPRGDDFFQAFVDMLRDKLGAEIAAVYLADPGRRSLELAAVSGNDDTYPRVGTTYIIASEDRRPGFHTGHSADAFRSGEMRVADDVFIDVEFVPWRVMARGDGCALSMPLMEQGAAFGVLNVYFNDRKQLTRQGMNLLNTIAASAGPAIGNIWAERCGRKPLRDELDLAA